MYHRKINKIHIDRSISIFRGRNKNYLSILLISTFPYVTLSLLFRIFIFYRIDIYFREYVAENVFVYHRNISVNKYESGSFSKNDIKKNNKSRSFSKK